MSVGGCVKEYVKYCYEVVYLLGMMTKRVYTAAQMELDIVRTMVR